jgi:hypothetical protein
MPESPRVDLTIGPLGTLGDSTGLTCSMDAARRHYGPIQIVPFERFELAAEATKASLLESFLVPAAYPKTNLFIMDPELEVAETFCARIPPLVVVGQDRLREAVSVFHHPATTPLLAEVGMAYQRAIPVDSNIEACKAAHQSSDSIAITNALCADYYNMPVFKVLRLGIKMPWIRFTKVSGDTSS